MTKTKEREKPHTNHPKQKMTSISSLGCKDEDLSESIKIVEYKGDGSIQTPLLHNLIIEQLKSHIEEIENKGKLVAIIETTLHDGTLIKIITSKTSKIVWDLITSSCRMITNMYH